MTSRVEIYTVGWICAITTEYVIAIELLDGEYPKHQTPHIDPYQNHNSYTFGRIHDHYVVVACLPKGRYGIASAARVARDMLRTFPAIRFGLMIGIGGGAPSPHHDIRLGDVVVSIPGSGQGGVINYDFEKAVQDRIFEATGCLSPPPSVLLTAISQLESLHKRKGHQIEQTINRILTSNKRLRKIYSRPTLDKLYHSSYVHKADSICDCQKDELTNSSFLVPREERDPDEDNPVIWYGLIASADKLMKNALLRDEITANHNVLCFEMEAAGLMDDFPCIVIRGVCDYSDSHKNDDWQGWAAATAASYTKELLGMILGAGYQDTHMINAKNYSQVQNIQDIVGPFEDFSLDDATRKQAQQQAIAHGERFYEQSELYKNQLEACHQVFRLLPPYEDQLYRTPSRSENTCAWVFSHHQFLSWKEAGDNAVLWISASPGSGKSVLSRAIVEERIVEHADVTCYFFFKDISASQRSISSALAAILHQLFTQRPGLIKHALSGYRANGKTLPNLFDVMWTILEQASMDPNAGSIVCVLDALDECEEAELPMLIVKIRDLYLSRT